MDRVPLKDFGNTFGKSAAKRRARFQKRPRWKGENKNSMSFYCPLCGIPRKIPYSPRPTLAHIGQIALTAVVAMLASWNWLEWRGIVSFVPMWVVFEMIYRARVRAAMVCGECGFDPVTYHTDLPRAKALVDAHFRKKFADKGIPYPEKDKQSPALNNAARTRPPSQNISNVSPGSEMAP